MRKMLARYYTLSKDNATTPEEIRKSQGVYVDETEEVSLPRK